MRAQEFRSFMSGSMPPWLERLQSRVERTIIERRLLQKGDRVLVGLSGGKDSLCLLLCLALCRRRPDMDMEIEAVTVDWEEAPLGKEAVCKLAAFCDSLDLPFSLLASNFPKSPHKDKTSCYGCARKRKELVFAFAAERGFDIVAFGHHLDDAAATSLMNLLGRGRVEGMSASKAFFGGLLRVIRPLIDLPEASLAHAAQRLGLPVAKIDCPNGKTNERDRIKPLMQRLRREFPHCRERLAGLPEKSLNLPENDAKVREG
jgi:tRNA 2-thiocytidine biosynthesis protein TtcA